MVNTVISDQLSVIRKIFAIGLSRNKANSFVFLLCFLSTAQAKDLGTHGVIFSIEEEDPIQLIQQKLKLMEQRGELKRHNIELQKKIKASVERPKPIEGITRAQKPKVFYYDPTYVVPEDLKDHLGRVFHRKGTKINPLETVSLSQSLLFLDGDDAQQKAWALSRMQSSVPSIENNKIEKVRLILIKGSPLKLSEELGIPVYFDQGGVLCKKLGIQHVPAVVTQDLPQQSSESSLDKKPARSLRLRIEEIDLGVEKR